VLDHGQVERIQEHPHDGAVAVLDQVEAPGPARVRHAVGRNGADDERAAGVEKGRRLGGMRANAPAEVFDGVWSLTRSVLDVADVVDLSGRLGLA